MQSNPSVKLHSLNVSAGPEIPPKPIYLWDDTSPKVKPGSHTGRTHTYIYMQEHARIKHICTHIQYEFPGFFWVDESRFVSLTELIKLVNVIANSINSHTHTYTQPYIETLPCATFITNHAWNHVNMRKQTAVHKYMRMSFVIKSKPYNSINPNQCFSSLSNIDIVQ